MDNTLKIYTDGGARGNPGPSASAFVAIEKGRVIYKNSIFLGRTTNNVAEYKAVILALEWFLKNKQAFADKSIIFFLDSELVVNQLSGIYKIKSKNLIPLLYQIKRLEKKIQTKVIYRLVHREKNLFADRLVNLKIDEKTS